MNKNDGSRIRSEAWHHRKEKKQLMKKEFRERFGKTFKMRVRVPDNYALQFFDLKNQLGLKNDSDRSTIKWLMNQAAPSIHQILGIPPREEASTSSVNPKNIQVNQVWALWDEQVDGMPRAYVRIYKILLEDLKFEVSFLEPVPNTDDEKRWYDGNRLPIACGTFKTESSTTTVDIFSFSHLVNIGEDFLIGRISYEIYPQKGEVWAVFKDWNINWTLHDFMTRTRYELVEVYSYPTKENRGLGIPLTRVGGTGTVFEIQFHYGYAKYLRFSEKELLQFSHRVPASKVIRDDINGIPCESWELDPAAVPLCLL